MTKIFNSEARIINDDSEPVPVSSGLPLATAIYEDGDSLYICKAAIGSALDAEVWQIQLLDSGAVPNQLLWCDGNSNFDNTATDLATVRSHSYL